MSDNAGLKFNVDIHDLGFDAFLQRNTNPLINLTDNSVNTAAGISASVYNDLRNTLYIDEILQKTFTALNNSDSIPEMHEIMPYKFQRRTVTPFVISYVIFNLTGDMYQGRTPYYDVSLTGATLNLNNYAFCIPSTTGITCNAWSPYGDTTNWTFLHYVLRNKNGKR